MTEEREPHVHTPEHDGTPPYDEVTALKAKIIELRLARDEARAAVLSLKDRIAELEAKLAAKSGMGIQENQPDTFHTLRR